MCIRCNIWISRGFNLILTAIIFLACLIRPLRVYINAPVESFAKSFYYPHQQCIFSSTPFLSLAKYFCKISLQISWRCWGAGKVVGAAIDGCRSRFKMPSERWLQTYEQSMIISDSLDLRQFYPQCWRDVTVLYGFQRFWIDGGFCLTRKRWMVLVPINEPLPHCSVLIDRRGHIMS